ncbi:YgjP-like metallopeptidase domain-containing protein [Mycoplasma anserisalpingitidis]|uniref:YgjP-like metallopeptidase domain-containing protein n=1 Tax=Mycoplasma anserisalpingitidis TaxID=519450 RepID=UPI0011B17766|nr:YgjP-like metallopeptidase domain-containing protein [Mycoplasma anserisalpingitidis]QDY87402.1 M48 family metallopeptidase [Mycoplasma anserisalpingitidis]UCU26907.1 M48 family metallopeptidase [Mycoplasma anserisalpingitidis]UCU27746.1 M48 family metallopeptidase [Mycoplasma anserisalpingitidis]
MHYQELDKLENIVEFNENNKSNLCYSWTQNENKLIINYNKNNDKDDKFIKKIQRRISKFHKINFYKKNSENYFVIFGKKIFYKYIPELKLISLLNEFNEIIICKNPKQISKSIDKYLATKLIELLKQTITDFNDPKLNEYNLIVKNNIKSFYGKINYSKKSFIFNLILIHHSIQEIKSVIFHEIAHFYTKGHNHDKVFYEKLIEICPEYKKYNDDLNNNKFI